MTYGCTVLLSGGMDSVAALHWARARHHNLDAVFFDYGQANRDAEIVAATRAARALEVPFDQYAILEAVRGHQALKPAPMGTGSTGVSLAFLPARNAVFLSCAAAHAAKRYGGQRVHLVVGCNKTDAERFPDCRSDFLSATSQMLTFALADVVRSVDVIPPWIARTKADVLRWAKAHDVVDAIEASVSCYAGTDCGACDACATRAAAFAEVGQREPVRLPLVMHGGDPSRTR